MANTLNGGRTYYVRARHKATNGLASEWSPPIRFTTMSGSVTKPTLRTPTLAANGSTVMDGYSVPNAGAGSGYSDGTSYPQSFEVSSFASTPGLNLKNLIVEWGNNNSFGQTITTASNIFSIVTGPSQTYYFRFKYVSTANIESPWSDTYSFSTSAPRMVIQNGTNFNLKLYADVRPVGGGWEADPETHGLLFEPPSFSWITTTWSYRSSDSGRIAFYDAPSGGNLIGSILVPNTSSSEYYNSWSASNSNAIKHYPAGLIAGRTYYLCLEAQVFNMIQYNTGSVNSSAPLPTGYYPSRDRVSLTTTALPTDVPASILNAIDEPIKLSNGRLFVNGTLFLDNYVYGAFVDFEIYNGATLTASETVGVDTGNAATYQAAWSRVKIYKNSSNPNYTIKARWRYSVSSSYFYPGGATMPWTTIKA